MYLLDRLGKYFFINTHRGITKELQGQADKNALVKPSANMK